jgi:hypothetical protein
MSDFLNAALQVKTAQNGDVVVQLCDGMVPSQKVIVDSNGRLFVLPGTAGSVSPGTAATYSDLVGGQYSTVLPTLTNGQQAALQVDSSGRLIISPLTSGSTVTANQGTPAAIGSAWPVLVTDGTNTASLTGAGEFKVSVTQPLPAGTNSIGTVLAKLEDGAGNAITSQASGSQQALDVGINVAGVQIDPRQIRALTSADVVTAALQVLGAPVTMSNPVPVTITATVPGTLVNKYNVTVNLAVSGTANHDYAITSGKTFTGRVFWASASGRIRADVQTSPDGLAFTTFWTGFNSAANPNILIPLDNLGITDTGTGATIRIVITNDDAQQMNVYSTISGSEV